MKNPQFWQEREKSNILTKEFSSLNKEIEKFEEMKKELELVDDKEKILEFEKKLRGEELKIFLSGKYDKNNAILEISAGVGGRDSEDWVTILKRMYERYCQRKGFEINIFDCSFGEGGGPEGRIGIKNVSMEIKGNFAFGFLKKESGVHRLVRISPFSPQSLRHTSFALVEVWPMIDSDEKMIEIKESELKIETFRASGPGGQYVNKRETAVRVIHLPTGLRVSCQSERSQGLNKEKAIKILKFKIQQLKEREKEEELKKIKDKKASPSWGNQIRNYVLHPYKLVKDLRTGIETSAIEDVLDGDLDEFIEAEIKIKENDKI